MESSRILYLDILNVIAVIAVMFMHCNGYSYSHMEVDAWKYAVINESICSFCVPVFLMITGATLMEYRKKYDTKTFYLRRIPKLILPWIISLLLASIILMGKFNLNLFIGIVTRYNGVLVYWFTPLIIAMYLAIPLLSVLVEKLENKKLLYGLGIYIFIFHFVLVPVLNMLNAATIPAFLEEFIKINPYLLYVITGYWLIKDSNKIFDKKKNRVILYLVSIILLIFESSYIIYFTNKEGIMNRDILGYVDFITFIYSVGVFIFIKYLNLNDKVKNKIQPICSWLAKKSYLFYTIHFIIILIFTKIFNFNVTTWFYRMILPIIVYFITIIVIYIIDNIKEIFNEETDN